MTAGNFWPGLTLAAFFLTACQPGVGDADMAVYDADMVVSVERLSGEGEVTKVSAKPLVRDAPRRLDSYRPNPNGRRLAARRFR